MNPSTFWAFLNEDWLEIVGEPSLTASDFFGLFGPYDPSEVDFRIWLAWNQGSVPSGSPWSARMIYLQLCSRETPVGAPCDESLDSSLASWSTAITPAGCTASCSKSIAGSAQKSTS